jgi:delta1-piperideine-2-carboxylate reductase
MATVALKLDEIFDLAKKTLSANSCDDETASILADLIMKAERDGSLSHGS